MAKNRVFFPQQALDEWLEQGRIALVDDEMTLKPDGQRYRLTSAIRILAEVTDGSDPNDLVGKVKTVEQIAGFGGEHVSDSLILGDNAYQVIEGFVGEPGEEIARAPLGAGAGSNLANAARAAVGDKTSSDDANPLMRFLLGKPS